MVRFKEELQYLPAIFQFDFDRLGITNTMVEQAVKDGVLVEINYTIDYDFGKVYKWNSDWVKNLPTKLDLSMESAIRYFTGGKELKQGYLCDFCVLNGLGFSEQVCSSYVVTSGLVDSMITLWFYNNKNYLKVKSRLRSSEDNLYLMYAEAINKFYPSAFDVNALDVRNILIRAGLDLQRLEKLITNEEAVNDIFTQ